MQPSYLSEDLLQYEIEAAQTYLDTLATSLSGEGRHVQTVMQLGAAADRIVQESRTANTGLIVMTTHGRTGLGRVLLGSVALAVLRRGALPVLLVRPTEQATQREALQMTPVAG